jgi:hypothetical protein
MTEFERLVVEAAKKIRQDAEDDWYIWDNFAAHRAGLDAYEQLLPALQLLGAEES